MSLSNLNNPIPNSKPTENTYFKNTTNRGRDVRRDTDKEKNFTVSLIDIDETIKSHIENVITPTVIDNGVSVAVPVLYGSPERWKAIQADGYFRDKNGKIQLPVMMLKRNTFTKNENMMTFNRYLSYPVIRKYSEKNKYDRFSMLNVNSITPVQQVHSVTLPDHIKVEYEVMVWTDKIEQMNQIIEKINFAANDYWGETDKLKFRTNVDSYSNISEITTEKDRLIRTEFTLNVFAYLLTDSFENRQETTEKFLTPRSVKITAEIVNGETMGLVKNTIANNNNKTGLTGNIVYQVNETFNRLAKNQLTSSNSGETKFTFLTGPKLPSDYGEDGWMSYDGQYHYVYSNGTWYKQSIQGFH